jgi:uncharacterized protein Smg (DUF494 family)
MNLKFWEKKESIVDIPLNKVLDELKQYGPDTPEFEKQLRYLERLNDLKTGNRQQYRVSPDTIALVLGNLAGILIIVAYEQKHVWTSKAMGFIKPKA